MKKDFYLAVVACSRTFHWLGCALFVLFFMTVCNAASAAEYPNGPIVLIVPYAPGDAVDNTGRVYANALGKELGGSVVVQNVTGGSGVVGLKNVLKAKPDGQTLGIAVGGSLVNAPMISKPGFVIEDFVPIAKLAELPFSLAVKTESPIRTLKDFIDAGKEKPLKIATPGSNSTQRMVITEFASKNGMKPIQHIAGKGGADTVTKLLTDEVDASFTVVPVFYPLAKGGKLRLLGIGTEERLDYLPDFPTFREQGYEMPDRLWIGLVGNRNIPQDIVKRLESLTKQASVSPELKEAMDKFKINVAWEDSKAFQDLLARDKDARHKVMKEIGLIKE